MEFFLNYQQHEAIQKFTGKLIDYVKITKGIKLKPEHKNSRPANIVNCVYLRKNWDEFDCGVEKLW